MRKLFYVVKSSNSVGLVLRLHKRFYADYWRYFRYDGTCHTRAWSVRIGSATIAVQVLEEP